MSDDVLNTRGISSVRDVSEDCELCEVLYILAKYFNLSFSTPMFSIYSHGKTGVQYKVANL